jgi:hypothetical protein
MVKDCSRVTISGHAWYGSIRFPDKKLTLLSIGCGHFSLGNPENDEGHYITFPRIFGPRIQLNETRVEAVDESAALQDNFLETEGSSQLPLSCSERHPVKQRVQETVCW